MSEMTHDLAHQIFDYKDGQLFWKVDFRHIKAGTVAGTKDKRYASVKYKGKKHLTHRIVFLMHHGYFPEMVDHINSNTFDNRIENLREANATQNAQNRPVISRSKTGVANVIWVPEHEKYRVRLSVNGSRKCFGYYDYLETAAVIAEQARQQHYGSFVYKGERT